MTRQFDVFPNPLRKNQDKPFVVCIQHHFLNHLNVRVVAPLVTKRAVQDQTRLYPAIPLGRQVLYFDPTDLISLPARLLRKPVANLESERYRIMAALDLVLTGL